jgi:hypothetical protein
VADPEGDSFDVLDVGAEAPLAATAVSGGLRLSAPANFHGARWLNLTVEDSQGARAVLSFLVTIFPVNDPPAFLTAVGPFVFLEDADAANATFSLAGLALDPDGDPVTFSLSLPSGISALLAGNTLVLTPAPDLNGDFAATLTISDGLASVSSPVTVRILPVDDAPRITHPAEQLVAREGANFSFLATATDIDTASTDLRYTFWLDGAAVAQNASSAAFTHYFGFDDAGFHVMRVAVTDGALSDAIDLSIFVSETNRAPSAAILTPRGATYPSGGVVTFSARALDPDATPVNITWVVDGRVSSTSATFSLDSLAPGEHSVVLLVSDGEFTTQDSSTFTVAGGAPSPGVAAAVAALAVAALAVAALRSRRA